MEPITGIDHVIVGVRDLESARETWRRLGFTLSPRGRHLEQPTGNYCVMFPSDYIELLGIVDTGASTHRLDSFLAWREGLDGHRVCAGRQRRGGKGNAGGTRSSSVPSRARSRGRSNSRRG